METDGREMNALTIFLMGLGILLFVLGPCTGFYSAGIGLVALIACWVLAVTLRVFYFGGNRDESRYRYS